MGEKKNPKGNIAGVWARLSPEERKAFVEARGQKIREAKAKAREEKIRQEELKGIKKSVLAEKISGMKDHVQVKKIKNELFKMQDKDYVPSWDALQTAVNLSKAGQDLETIRADFFPQIPQETWVKFKKSMFAVQISSPEDVGNDLLVARDMVIGEIKKEIKKMREQQDGRPQKYHNEIVRALSTIHSIESDTAKRLVDIGAVGTKRSGGISVQIVNYIPRPDRPIAHDKKPVTNYITTAPKELKIEEKDVIEIPVLKEKVKA